MYVAPAFGIDIMESATFWDNRYRSFPELGSGPGSRGYAALYKRRLVKASIKQFSVSSIVDIGCGDLCWLDKEILECCSYRGVDVSPVAIERAKVAYPSLPFDVYDVTAPTFDIKADLVVSFDVLIHQIDAHRFCLALDNTLRAINRIGLVSYMTPPLPDGNFLPPASLDPAIADKPELEHERAFCQLMAKVPDDRPRPGTAFHQPIPTAVAALRQDLTVTTAGRYRRHTVYAIYRYGNFTAR
jgi:hypothetical protein